MHQNLHIYMMWTRSIIYIVNFLFLSEKIFNETLPKCTQCDTLVKPDVVFFGENLPARFFDCMQKDFPECDLLIIMGTSLVVQPFSHLVDR